MKKCITDEQKIKVSAKLIGQSGKYGLVQKESKQLGFSRKTLYQWRNKAENILNEHLNPRMLNARSNEECIRQVLTLYTEGHASLEGIQHCLQTLSGQYISIGRLCQIINEAGERALLHLAKMVPPLSCDVALDEIFGHGPNRAYLNIVDVHSYAVLASSGPHPLDNETWQLLLSEVEERGIKINTTISDGGSAILKSIAQFYPDRLHRRDIWHIFKAVQKLQRKMLKDNLPKYVEESLRYLLSELKELVSVVVIRGKKVLCLQARMEEIAIVMELFEELGESVSKVTQQHLLGIRKQFRGIYDELIAFGVDLEEEQEAVRTFLGEEALSLIGWAWQRRKKLGPEEEILASLPAAWRESACGLFVSWGRSVRASSAVENWHSILRPHLAVHRRLSPGQLALLCVWHNYRVFKRGEHKGKSPLQMCGVIDQSADWLTALGYSTFSVAEVNDVSLAA